MDFKNYLEKLRELPDKQKKIILWSVVAVLAVIMGIFWLKSAGQRFSKIGENLGQIKLPKIETPNIIMPTNQTAEMK